MTKAALNRLGDRMKASAMVAEADLQELALVLAAYQDVLERVRSDLQELGFSPGWRAKTTSTLVDKLRRISGMKLSRVQDLAGARIVVPDLIAQDHAAVRIRDFYEERGCSVKAIDRRAEPTYGYRAMHLVVAIDSIPVEIQIRTELQDAWAQMVERLADSWGRGIRYGEAPQEAGTIVRTGGFRSTRSGAVGTLRELSDAVKAAEEDRREHTLSTRRLSELDAQVAVLYGSPPSGFDGKIPGQMLDNAAQMLANVRSFAHELRPSDAAILELEPVALTVRQLLRLVELANGEAQRLIADRTAKLEKTQEDLRYILRLVADAAANQGV